MARGSVKHLIRELDYLQVDMHDWRMVNFPDTDTEQQLLGVMEELGELSHARLKHIQGIRGLDTAAEYEHKERDAIGDILVFLAGYASLRGISMAECLVNSWNEVKDRDWVQYPFTGLPPLKEVQ